MISLLKNKNLLIFLNLITGAVTGQILYLIMSPLIMRSISVIDLGEYSKFSSVIAIASVLGYLTFDRLVMEVDKKEIKRIMAIVIALSFIVSLSTVFFFTLNWHWLKIGSIMMIAPNVILANITEVSRYNLIREKNFKYIAVSQFCLNFTRGIAAILLINILPGYFALALSDLIGRVFVVFYQKSGKLILDGLVSIFKEPAHVILLFCNNYFSQFMLTISMLTDAITFWGPPLIIAYFYDVSAAGQFALAQKILSMLPSLIGKALADIFHVEIESSEYVYRRTYVIFFETFLLGAFLFLIIYRFKDTLQYIFGDQWTELGNLLLALLPFSVAFTFLQILIRLLMKIKLQKLIMHCSILLSVLTNSIYIILGYYRISYIYASCIVSFAVVFLIIMIWLYVLYFMRREYL